MSIQRNKYPLVSVVVPAYNEEDVLDRLLKSVTNQSYRNTELILVDDGSTDNTVRIAEENNARVFERKHAERSVQRNFGAKNAKGKYLLFLDADMEVSKNVVKECVELAETDKSVGAIVIPERSVAKTFWEEVKAYERSIYSIEGDASIEAARFFPRKLFEKVGGYDEKITGPEDWDLPERILKLGHKQKRIRAKILHYERVPNPLELAKKKYYYALKAHRYLKRHNIPAVSAKTIYFLRPVFYKNWKLLISHPKLSTAMLVMLTIEQIGGGLGYLIGRFKRP